jgi:hypothetical protein
MVFGFSIAAEAGKIGFASTATWGETAKVEKTTEPRIRIMTKKLPLRYKLSLS